MPPRKRSGTQPDKSPANNHAVGLVPPTKRRPVKQKSTAYLNAANEPTRTPTLPPHCPDAGLDLLPSPSPSSSSDGSLNDIPPTENMGADQSRPNGGVRTVSASVADDLEANGTANGASQLTIDVKTASGNASLHHQKTFLETATTILRACPLWDVIAMLIVLLQLPPTVVSVVQFLFALLTFVPPTATTLNLPSLNDIMAGASGAPSFQTILLVDVIMFIAFVSLWAPVQNVALDLAQAVIAISLGGAAASKGGTSNSILCCVFIIGISHLIRAQSARQFGLNALWAGLSKTGLRDIGNVPVVDVVSQPSTRLHATHGIARKIIGVHILTQGVVRLVRRWYLYSAAQNNKKADSEFGPLSTASTPRTGTSIGDSGADTTGSASTDGRPPGPSPAAREKEHKISNTKKKKKQANHVRSQQPFWAALANAKVTFLKELENQQASSDAMEANAMDVVQIGNANFKNGMERVWIREVWPTEISFGVCLPSRFPEQEETQPSQEQQNGKTIRVRLNRTDWSSTRIVEEAVGVEAGDEQVDVWNGKIFGLTASTNYICEFIRVDTGEVFYTTHITTQPLPSTEQAPATAVQPQSLRPLSPKTTLKNSILAAEQQLEAQRNRIKRNKRDHKNTLTNLQKEVDSLNSRLSSNGGNDERQRQKVRQLEQTMQQAKVKESELLAEIEELGEIPADELQQSKLKRTSWKHKKECLSVSRKDHDDCKARADRELSQVKADIANLLQKRQKLEQKASKYNEQHDRLCAEKEQSQKARDSRVAMRNEELRSRGQIERKLIEHTAQMELAEQSHFARATKAIQMATHLEELYTKNVQQQSMPTTPEGPLPGTTRISGLQHHNTFPGAQPGYQFPNMMHGFNDNAYHSNTTSTYREGGRGRSSSMLSGVSGFTDELDDYPLPAYSVAYTPVTNGAHSSRECRKSSAGSGSSSSPSGGSSNVDPLSPAPKTLSPVFKNSPMSPPATATGIR
ncbi:hypothetical protein BLS_004530 [Venturia inaequalis]|uniref:Ubiquitination network signaling protein n=1 Tax=Venturia inaequalis TaxID=5025 RepID=A0A8H3VBX5_VENIN|nr:hypothetical protein BLS_004530 [Venturia inaequalis]KAE9994020.1 hypothetical protein EG327_001753 [Venturia inaequalis]RDI84076.1 hypothetical protein Vi05172_g5855 [Venturia inaequalis]